jgi:hypothetical protein
MTYHFHIVIAFFVDPRLGCLVERYQSNVLFVSIIMSNVLERI